MKRIDASEELSSLVTVLAELEIRGLISWRLTEEDTLIVDFTEQGRAMLREEGVPEAALHPDAKGEDRGAAVGVLRRLVGIPGYSAGVPGWVEKHGMLS